MRHSNPPSRALLSSALVLTVVFGACSNNGSDNATVTVQGDVPLAYTTRSSSINANPTNGAPTAPGGDLKVREKSSPSAPEYNVTASITQGNGDVSDPEVSYDGKKIVFALRCPTSNTSTINGGPACTGRWNIWEYDMTTGGYTGGTLRRITASTEHDDVDPAYMPGNRGFVFTSNRQTKSRTNQAGGATYFALDEYERERVFNLHTMADDGSNIEQISVNQSHDRNPVVKSNGDIMFSRWEHVGPRNRFAIFSAKPDGTNMFVFYGAQSPGNSFLHPREMDPSGPYAGFLTSSLMSLSGTREGGALMLIDAANYSENNTPANRSTPNSGGQAQMTAQRLNDGRGLSDFGRVTTPYPLWDGTNRILVSYTPCQVTRNGVVVACATLTDAERALLADDERSDAERALDAVQDNVPPSYAVYMFDPAQQTWLIVAAPPPGFMNTDPIALQSRTEPGVPPSTSMDPALAAVDMGLIEVRSIYDTDGLGRMAEGMLVASDMGAGCSRSIAMKTSTDPTDTRNTVPDLVAMKDPADPAYHCAPGRFVRVTRAVAPSADSIGMRTAIGETDFEPQQILGYAPIEPDGSFKLQVPADVALGIAVVDAQGRAIQTHLNWIQVRPGERRTCDGCHSPRRGASLNSTTVVNSLPDALRPALASAHLSGETMASLRTRLDPSLLNLSQDMDYTDVWADTTRTGVTARASISISYAGLTTPAPTNGIINYPDHIQPLWTKDRGANTCINCHADPTVLDLRATTGGTGRLTSYDELLIGDPLLDANGQPITRIEEGVPVLERGTPLVETMGGNAVGHTRGSRLGEIMFGETLKAGAEAATLHPDPPPTAPNHATLLNASEKRLLAEWMDLGGQYFNSMTSSASGVRTVNGLSRSAFEASVMPVLTANCIGCHQPTGNSGAAQTGVSFLRNRYVLTGDAEGDYNVTLGMINDTCNAAANPLLSRPSTVPHPAGATTQTTPVLATGSAGYNAIAAWIATGC